MVKRRLLLCWCLIFPVLLGAQEGVSPAPARWPLLIGSDGGLYGVDSGGNALVLWSGGAVRKILRNGNYWAVLSDAGILISPDLLHWESRNQGLPVKTIKVYEEKQKSFISLVQEIKDLELHPGNPEIMVCATKDQVFLTRNGGGNWENLGAPPYRTNGIKAVAAADLPELTVFLSHSVYGVYYITPEKSGARWTELNRGLEKLETTDNPDEVSDIAVALPGENPDEGAGRGSLPLIYAAQTFRRRLYRLDWEQKQFLPIWSDSAAFGTADSLDIGEGAIRFIQEGTVVELNYPGVHGLLGPYSPEPLSFRYRRDINEFIEIISTNLEIKPNCLSFRENVFRPDSEFINLSELWLLAPPDSGPAQGDTGTPPGREGLYLPVNHALDNGSLQPYLDILDERALNMVVIDMKDDYGRLRFTPRNPAITEKGRVFRPVDIDGFLKTMKERGIYTAARIVVFKDPELARKEGGKLAVWDGRNNKPWVGYYDTRRKKSPATGSGGAQNNADDTEILPDQDPEYEILRTYYDERWVDPYAEEVWEYTAAIAAELHERGFDEIQFDYIRFPTDGANLADARYRWQEPGMDMESAILSFLRHVRSRLDAPISVDIYGANGWYRTGARTGQEVELMAPYVDVICPMYYPSHFEQDFLAQNPPELRPYRIYYLGTQRTARIARGQVIVRPYAQAFYLNVSYDRKYYNADYVRLQTEGVRDAENSGLTYWNNSGRYDDIPFPRDFSAKGDPVPPQ